MLFSALPKGIAAGKSRLHDTRTFRPIKVSYSICSCSCLFLASYPVNDHAGCCCNDCQNSHDFHCFLFHVSASSFFMRSLVLCPVNDCADNGCHCNCDDPCCFPCFLFHSHFLPFLFFLLFFFFPLPLFPPFFLSVFFPVSSSIRISRIVSSPSVDT